MASFHSSTLVEEDKPDSSSSSLTKIDEQRQHDAAVVDEFSLTINTQASESSSNPSNLLKAEAIARASHQASEILSDIDMAYIDLFDVLNKGGIPIHIFDDVQRWASRHSKSLNDLTGFTRKTFLRELRRKVYGYTCGPYSLQPTTTLVTLSSGKIVNVTTLPFMTSLISMLTNQNLMDDGNLLLDLDDPFSPPCNNGELGDVNSGRWYFATWNKLCTTPN